MNHGEYLFSNDSRNFLKHTPVNTYTGVEYLSGTLPAVLQEVERWGVGKSVSDRDYVRTITRHSLTVFGH